MNHASMLRHHYYTPQTDYDKPIRYYKLGVPESIAFYKVKKITDEIEFNKNKMSCNFTIINTIALL